MSIKESALSAITSITQSDFIRAVTAAGASRRVTVANLAKAIIEQYTGSSLAGSAQSVKAALDALNSNMTIETLQDCGSLTDISNALNTKLGTMASHSIAQIRFAATASFAPFASGSTYLGELRKTASTTYSCVIFYGLGARSMIFGYKTASGWSFASCTLS